MKKMIVPLKMKKTVIMKINKTINLMIRMKKKI